ncbi:hypothetical protein FB451DRAFT_1391249 [Mycena latifolia]|nr:hypothetical protein FB451DRAFT_1391249 [Mycena latifolia]
MSTVVTLQNALDLPSPVTLHFDDPDFELDCPHSPTSSLKGVFVRSRPNSMDLSDSDAPALLSHFEEFGMTGNTRVPFIHAPPASRNIYRTARDTPGRDDYTVRTTATSATTGSPIRAVRRVFDDDTDDEADVPPVAPADGSTRRRTWPSMNNLRSRVSGIFHRKHTAAQHAPTAPPPPTPTDSCDLESSSSTSTENLDITHSAPAPRPRRTFSFSLRSRSRTSSISSTKLPAPVGHIATRTRRVRRSRSFSGFTSMAHQVLAPIPDADGGEDLDDVTLEASNTVRGIGQFWVYEEDESEAEAAAGVLERAVERG